MQPETICCDRLIMRAFLYKLDSRKYQIYRLFFNLLKAGNLYKLTRKLGLVPRFGQNHFADVPRDVGGRGLAVTKNEAGNMLRAFG